MANRLVGNAVSKVTGCWKWNAGGVANKKKKPQNVRCSSSSSSSCWDKEEETMMKMTAVAGGHHGGRPRPFGVFSQCVESISG